MNVSLANLEALARPRKKDDDLLVVDSTEVVRTKKARTVKSAKPDSGRKRTPPQRFCSHCGARIGG